MKESISLIILTYNEEANLRKCLKSVEGLPKEIIIVDSGSTDETKRIAEEFGARFVVHEFKNQADQFNWALANTHPKGDWIMRLDADEEILPELKKEIEEKLSGLGAEVGGVILRRRTYFLGKWMKHGGIYPTELLRIFRNGQGMSEEREMDEHLILKKGRTVTFKNDFIDNNLKGLEEWKEKHRKYAVREAKAYFSRSEEAAVEGSSGGRRWLKKHVYYRMPVFLRVIFYFIYRYIFLFGFLDGCRGAEYHFLQAFWYRWLVDMNIWKAWRGASS